MWLSDLCLTHFRLHTRICFATSKVVGLLVSSFVFELARVDSVDDLTRLGC